MKPCITYTQQRGHAAILFALMIPLLFGVFILGTDGARALQDKARLEEASEVAALAIAGQSGGSTQSGDKLARDYIQYYFPHADVNKIETQVIPCEDNEFCDQDGAASERFFEYQVAAHIKEPNWFSKSSIETSFGDNLNIGGYSSARKYQSKTVDVVLVADFSGSMKNPIITKDNPYNRTPKYKDLQNIISDVADAIESYNKKSGPKKSTMGFVGFNIYTYPYPNSQFGYNYLICDRSLVHLYSNFFYYQANNGNGGIRIDGPLRNPSGNKDRNLNDGWCGQLYNDNGYTINNRQYVDYYSTVMNIFNMSLFTPSLRSYDNGMLAWKNQKLTLKFHDIPLTIDVKSLSRQVRNFEPQGGTAFYSGLIRGAQIADQGSNPRRLIIILSDGMNSSDIISQQSNLSGSITNSLLSFDMCKKITKHLNSEVTDDGDKIKSRLFAIGFGYEATDYPQMEECVGKNNVYDSNEPQKIKSKILELIAEEMGRLTPSDEK